MLAPFSAPSRGIAVLILPGGPLRFQIGEVTGVSTYRAGVSAYGAALTASTVHGIGVIARDWRDRSRSVIEYRRNRLRAPCQRLRSINGFIARIKFINDRGPFNKGRVLDLSTSAAKALGMTERGVVLVRADVL